MGLEELTFDVEGVKLRLKPELQVYHYDAQDNPFIGLVPVMVEYSGSADQGRKMEEGYLCYDISKRIFITALSDFVPTDPGNTSLLMKYAEGMSEIAGTYSGMMVATVLARNKLITEKHFYRNSQGEWKDIGDFWIDVYSEKELLAMADAVENDAGSK